jgi:NADP-dependent aldehyde dehydrogenase
MITEGAHLLGRDRQSAGERFVHRSPVDGGLLEPSFPRAGISEVDCALTLACAAEAGLSELPIARRADLLEHIARALEEAAPELLPLTHRETGLPPARLQSECARTAHQLRFFAALVRAGDWLDARIDAAQPQRAPIPKPDIRMLMRPVGPVAVFGASNFPLAFSVAGGDTAAALAAGCPVIVKAHPRHPCTSQCVGEMIQRTIARLDLPAGAFSLLHGDHAELSIALVTHPALKAVAFTGSLHAGRRLYDAAADRSEPIPVFAEMASVNPIFLLPQRLAADSQAVAQGWVQSLTLGAGQFCTKPGLLFAASGPALQQFVAAAAAQIEKSPATTMLHWDIKHAYEEDLRSFTKLPGVRAIARGHAAAGCEAMSVLHQTTSATFMSNPRLHGELFGPSALIVECTSIEDMVRVAGRLPGQLTAALHATEQELAACRPLLHILQAKAGRLILNQFPTGVEVTHAMVHGGGYPSCTDSRFSAVGALAIRRFLRPVCYQNFPDALLPAALQDANPLGVRRSVDGA